MIHRLPAFAVAALLMAACATPPDPPTPAPTTPSPGAATTEPTPSAVVLTTPTFSETPCPKDVTVIMVVVPTCGYLTVEERRDDPTGPEVRIFVIRIEPATLDAPDPMVVVGDTLGANMEHGGLAPLAQRAGRVAYLVDRRGTGFSEPNIECLDIGSAGHRALERPSFDPGAIAEIASRVHACGKRLAAAGHDPAAFDIEASARDIEDLRTALGIDAWNVIGFGSASRLAVDVARIAPAGVRTVTLDSIVTSGRDDPIVGVEATRHALREVARSCAADPGCHAAMPDFEDALAEAISELDREPLVAPATTDLGAAVVDGPRFARAVRALIGDESGKRMGIATSAIDQVRHGSFTADAPIVREIRDSTDLCLGHLPTCRQLNSGSTLTTICRDVLPVVDGVPAADDLAGLGRAFRLDDWTQVCEAWNVAPAPDPRGDTGLGERPVLIMNGQFDPYTGPIGTLDGLDPLPGRGLAIEVPNQSYNAFGFDQCPRSIRRAWLDDPTVTMLDTTCFADIPPIRVWTAPS